MNILAGSFLTRKIQPFKCVASRLVQCYIIKLHCEVHEEKPGEITVCSFLYLYECMDVQLCMRMCGINIQTNTRKKLKKASNRRETSVWLQLWEDLVAQGSMDDFLTKKIMHEEEWLKWWPAEPLMWMRHFGFLRLFFIIQTPNEREWSQGRKLFYSNRVFKVSWKTPPKFIEPVLAACGNIYILGSQWHPTWHLTASSN